MHSNPVVHPIHRPQPAAKVPRPAVVESAVERAMRQDFDALTVENMASMERWALNHPGAVVGLKLI